ncbi:MAG: flagellar basal body P-ring protein FlgI [Phycisphaerales bacterium]|nr:flagellar basal body P-ring protein FlgI [Planctomycetota bacterium]MCH8509025.1 flagellar basal body P-ring protein FlgI [Phycisphaerales bacterium]
MSRTVWIAILLLSITAADALASRTLREVARLRGQGASTVQGLGLVVGLNNTGDSASELAVARPLAEVLRRMGNSVSIDELGNTRSVALVLITCEIPREGAMTDDRFDVTISVLNSAKSLQGGTLLMAPLTPGPDTPVYAFARGELTVPDRATPTSARISRGAQMVRDVVTTPAIAGGFDLILDQNFSLGGASARIASEINQQYLLTANRLEAPIATAIDARTIRVKVPPTERNNPQAFYGDVMRTDITSALRELPAQVICDTRAGVIVMTGDVLVSPAIITHRDLTISTIIPPPPPDAPRVERREFAAVGTSPDEADRSRLEDLIGAFDQLKVPPVEQIRILQMLHRAGKLHARLIVDGQE